MSNANIKIKDLFQNLRILFRSWFDSRSIFLTVSEHNALHSGFDITEVSTREVVLADGGRKIAPMIGPLRIYFKDCYCDVSALMMRDEALFGAVPKGMMDLVLHPATQTLCVNPPSAFVPDALTK